MIVSWRCLARFALLPLFLFLVSSADPGEAELFLREEFNNLDRWKPFYFARIERRSSYSIVSTNGESFLKAQSEGSASAIIYEGRFNVYEFPKARWRWKVENVYRKGDAKTKEGDDYPLRIYLIFQYDPKRAGLLEKAKYESAKLIYGEYPPHSGLNYIWANKKHEEPIITNPYSARSKMIPLQHGEKRIGTWVSQEVDILEDYKRAFGERPPSTASIAIMNDSDNTGERSTSYLDFLEIYRE